MIKFEEHDGLIFKMLDKPVPLKENDENVLVRFITHGVIGEYVMEHWLDCNQKNVPIYIDDVDSDGDVTIWIDEKRNEHHCLPFPMFEIIGTLVKEDSADWALHQMMKGEKVFRVEWECGMYCQYTNNEIITFRDGISSTINPVKEWIANAKRADSGWQIYKEPKPLLAEAKVGDLCQRRDGKWVQIDRLVSIGGLPWICYEAGGQRYINTGTMLNYLSTEPLAPEGTAEWAWQMNKLLGKKVMHSHSNCITDGNITCENKGMFIAVTFDTGWQLCEPKEEPQPDKEPIANCENCKHVCTKSNIDHCHMYEPKVEPPKEPDYVICKRCGGTGYEIKEPCDAPNPESATQTPLSVSDATQLKVGDWVEWCGDQYMVESAPPQSGGRYNIRSPYDELGCSVCPENITRKLSPHEVVIHIGCLKGTVKRWDSTTFHMFHGDSKFSKIHFDALDKETRELVESLLKAQEEK